MPEVGLKSGGTNHGGTITTGAYHVFVEDRPVARVGDTHVCGISEHGTNTIIEGSPHVFVEGKPVARIGDSCGCGAALSYGHAFHVFVYDDDEV